MILGGVQNIQKVMGQWGCFIVGLLYSEEYPTHEAAAKREIQIKRWGREKKLNLIKYGKLVK